MAAMAAQVSFHYDIQGSIRASSATTGIPISFVGDVVAPDRMRGKLNVNLGLLALEVETIVIGEATYTTNLQTAEWELGPGLPAALPDPSELARLGAKLVDELGDVELVGLESLEGLDAYRISGASLLSDFGGPEGEAQVDIWIDVEDFLVVQVTGEGKVSLEGLGQALSAVGLTGEVVIETTLKLSAFGEPVVIEAPQVE